MKQVSKSAFLQALKIKLTLLLHKLYYFLLGLWNKILSNFTLDLSPECSLIPRYSLVHFMWICLLCLYTKVEGLIIRSKSSKREWRFVRCYCVLGCVGTSLLGLKKWKPLPNSVQLFLFSPSFPKLTSPEFMYFSYQFHLSYFDVFSFLLFKNFLSD